MHAAQDIKKGDIILFVPDEYLIDMPKVSEGSEIAKKMFYHCTKNFFGQHILFAAYILTEKKKPRKDRKFAEFFDVLPKQFNEWPLFFTEDDLAYLEGSPFKEFIKDHNLKMK